VRVLRRRRAAELRFFLGAGKCSRDVARSARLVAAAVRRRTGVRRINALRLIKARTADAASQ
jgi:hypothetical protein